MDYILVVDDDWMNREILEAYLQGEDYEVVAVNSGPKAIEIATERPPALVILDLNMPGMNGFEVCQHLKSQVLTTFSPVMVVSGRESEEDMRQALEAGADDFLVKPFNAILVLARVRSLVRLYQLEVSHTRTVFFANWQSGDSQIAAALVQRYGGQVETISQSGMIGFFPVVASVKAIQMLQELRDTLGGVRAGVHSGAGILGTLAHHLSNLAPVGTIVLSEAVLPYVQHQVAVEPFSTTNTTIFQVK